MTAPAFNEPFSDAYDTVSMHRKDLPKHAGCFVYTPDNYDDYQCLALWQPAPELGAREWTRNGKRVLLAVYRDEGRTAQRQPATTMTWSRVGASLTVTCSKKHYLDIGDVIDLESVNVSSLTAAVSAITDLTFTVTTANSGMMSGSGSYSPQRVVNFAEDYVVFRLLPTFKPVSISIVLDILAAADPTQSRETATLTNIATGATQPTSNVITRSTSVLYRRHRQQLDELRKPLRQVYDARGRVIPPDLRFSKHSNARLYVNVPMVNQHDPIPTSNTRLPAYDFYGFELNDPTRGPFYSSTVIHYDASNAVGLARSVNGGQPIYSGQIHDVFGDYVVGARSNNTLITRKPVQPIRVDHHNTPYKRPIGRG